MDIAKIAFDYVPLKDISGLANSYWITLKNQSGSVEGILHLPRIASKELLIFEPGFPGGGSGYFEETMLKQVLEDGKAAFFIRHVGTLINGKYSAGYIVCEEKQKLAKNNNQEVLGTKDSHTIADWLVEPLVALEILSPHFEEIILTGHSFGPLAAFSSLIDFNRKNPEGAKKVKRFISMSGTLGVVRDPNEQKMQQWREYLNKDWSKERVLLGDAEDNMQALLQNYKKIHYEIDLFPSHTQFIAIHSWGDKKNSTDELVHIVESLDMITSLGRGYLIVDKTEYGTEDMARMAHDMENLTPEAFSSLINLNWIPEAQISSLN